MSTVSSASIVGQLFPFEARSELVGEVDDELVLDQHAEAGPAGGAALLGSLADETETSLLSPKARPEDALSVNRYKGHPAATFIGPLLPAQQHDRNGRVWQAHCGDR